MVERVHHSLKDEIPEFDEYLNKESEDSSSEQPINAFREWKQIVENLIEDKTERIDDFHINPNDI